MKKFFKNLIYLVITIAILCLGLDQVYTYIHKNTAPRNIPDYIMQLTPKDSLDYVILGSSRALHGLDPLLIKKQTQKKGFNFGVPGSSFFEIKLTVKQLLKKNITKNIYIQVDYIWNEVYNSEVPTIGWLTYINDREIYNDFKEIDSKNEYILYNKIPFYRYIKFDSKLGFRELLMSLFNRHTSEIENSGYAPLFGKLKNSKSTFKYTLNQNINPHVAEIIALCKKNNINVFFFTAPIYNFQGNNTVLTKNLTNYTDFSNSVSDFKLYQDNTHLNINGSELFTELFIKTYFNHN
ncbi:hypothetical protein [Formosa sp. L2A11]|uniref:hypothetical protein n=1 Tax=Formosa sp. L2A11 TaxID=2686363 RepID=UPI00131AA2CC|nr:hypothetical protein [Formosa sp. L2A11]